MMLIKDYIFRHKSIKNQKNMKKQIFTIILFTVVSLNVLGQFKLDGGLNSLRLQTGGIDRMYIHPTTGNIGVGTTSPNSKFHAFDGSAGAVTATPGTVGTFESNSNTFLSVLSPSSALGGMLFASPTGTARGSLLYNHSVDLMTLATANATRLTIDGSGNVGVGTIAPSTKLYVEGTSVSSTPITSTLLTLANNNDSYLTFLSASSSTSFRSGLIFGSTLGSSKGSFTYTPFNNQMQIATNSLTRMIVDGNGNVSIGSTTPTAKLDIDGDIVVKKITVSTTGAINALNRLSASSIYFNGSLPTLNGIAGGVDGMILYVFTSAGSTLILANESASATFVNRIATHTGANVTISGRGGATLIYESSTARWRVVGVAN